jgi:hypothetical protein
MCMSAPKNERAGMKRNNPHGWGAKPVSRLPLTNRRVPPPLTRTIHKAPTSRARELFSTNCRELFWVEVGRRSTEASGSRVRTGNPVDRDRPYVKVSLLVRLSAPELLAQTA